jgi:hypothetical protein
MKWEPQRALWEMAYEVIPEIGPLRPKASTFIGEMGELAKCRNMMIHGLWGLLFGPGELLQINLTTIKSKAGTADGLLAGRGLISIDWLHNFSGAANRLNFELLALTAPLFALRGEPPPHTRRL